LAIADVNGDCAPDIITYGPQGLWWYLNNGDGTFGQSGSANANLQYEPMSMATADMNADGKPDVVIASQGTVGILLNSSANLFVNEVDTPTPTSIGDVSGLAIADFNGDEAPDVVIASGPALAVLLNDGHGALKPGLLTQLDPQDVVTSVATADFDKDGKVDIAVSASGGLLLMGHGDGTFGPPQTISTPPALYWTVVFAADFNGDGYPDLADGNSLLLNDGHGALGTVVSFPPMAGPADLAAGDFLGNGLLGLSLSAGANVLSAIPAICQ
jgi:FG-GAP-like repeat